MEGTTAIALCRYLMPSPPLRQQLQHYRRHGHFPNPVLLLFPPTPTSISSSFSYPSFSAITLNRRHLFLPRCPTIIPGGVYQEAHSDTSPPPSTISAPGLVLDLGPPHSWDGGEVGSPVVKRFVSDDRERWLMWYHGRRAVSSGHEVGDDSIGLAFSANGIHWERGNGDGTDGRGDDGCPGFVMSRSTDWWAFDNSGVRPSEVLIMSSDKVRAPSSVYWLYYTGFSSDKVATDADTLLHRSFPGLAMSQDGQHWARIEGDHHSNALFNVGASGEWDSLFVAAPKVVYHTPGNLRMYYHSFNSETGHYSIGMARSRDGIQWVKLGTVVVDGGGGVGSFDDGGMTNGHVVKNRRDGSYVMAYEGVSADGRRSIGLAKSPDGLKNWRRCGEEAVLKPCEAGGWDDKEAGSPYLVQVDSVDEEWRLYYRGIGGGGRTGIGLAVCSSREISTMPTAEFRRWEGFRL